MKVCLFLIIFLVGNIQSGKIKQRIKIFPFCIILPQHTIYMTKCTKSFLAHLIECPEGYQAHSSLINSKFCYKYYKYGNKDWSDAKLSCRNDGGELVCFENVHERNFYSNLCPRCWVGYEWIDGMHKTL